MVSIVGIEQAHLGGSSDRVVVGVFRKGEQLVPIVLVVVDEGSEVLFQGLVQTFCLAVALGVEGRRQVSFYSHDFR